MESLYDCLLQGKNQTTKHVTTNIRGILELIKKIIFRRDWKKIAGFPGKLQELLQITRTDSSLRACEKSSDPDQVTKATPAQ